MRKQLTDLREKMRENHIDAYLIPTTDFHGSEYVNDYFKCRKFVSGFTGSAGTLVVTLDEAWLDGVLQANGLARRQVLLLLYNGSELLLIPKKTTPKGWSGKGLP